MRHTAEADVATARREKRMATTMRGERLVMGYPPPLDSPGADQGAGQGAIKLRYTLGTSSTHARPRHSLHLTAPSVLLKEGVEIADQRAHGAAS
jgi:hypothetical protein